jgi:hypothetical protein
MIPPLLPFPNIHIYCFFNFLDRLTRPNICEEQSFDMNN